jgi:hypothetical protein
VPAGDGDSVPTTTLRGCQAAANNKAVQVLAQGWQHRLAVVGRVRGCRRRQLGVPPLHLMHAHRAEEQPVQAVARKCAATGPQCRKRRLGGIRPAGGGDKPAHIWAGRCPNGRRRGFVLGLLWAALLSVLHVLHLRLGRRAFQHRRFKASQQQRKRRPSLRQKAQQVCRHAVHELHARCDVVGAVESAGRCCCRDAPQQPCHLVRRRCLLALLPFRQPVC